MGQVGRVGTQGKAAGVGRFLYAGSCSVYGAGDKLDLEETIHFKPVSSYAQSKVESEYLIGELRMMDLRPCSAKRDCVRVFADGCGSTGRETPIGIRLAYGEIRIQSDGSPWRPLIHCRDISRAFMAFARRRRGGL